MEKLGKIRKFGDEKLGKMEKFGKIRKFGNEKLGKMDIWQNGKMKKFEVRFGFEVRL